MRPERSPVHSRNSTPSAPTPVLRAQSRTASSGSHAPSTIKKSLPQAWALTNRVIHLSRKRRSFLGDATIRGVTTRTVNAHAGLTSRAHNIDQCQALWLGGYSLSDFVAVGGQH